jgi:uncharacterized protein YutE (UPF0331/DUF86 family)
VKLILKKAGEVMRGGPWVSGPSELLEHGLELLKHDSDKNRRLAIIGIDNSVELTVKTFLGLPKRVSGLAIARNKYAEFSESFPKLLDALEEYAADKITGINLGEIEWYHRLRNELYHQGNGLTVERAKVEAYAELAKLLMKMLFGVEVEKGTTDKQRLLGAFIEAWADLEIVAVEILRSRIPGYSPRASSLMPFNELERMQIIEAEEGKRLKDLQRIRNGVVHGKEKAVEELNTEMIREIQRIAAKVRNRLEEKC